MKTEEFIKVCELLCDEMRRRAPKDTGNLAFNGIRMEIVSNDEVKIYVDEKIAPYMVYTNEEWISPKWNGKKNPNEGWWNDTCEYVARKFADYARGDLIKK